MKTYVFRVELEQDEDGRWGAEIPSMPGCATWGCSKEEALETLREATQAYLKVPSDSHQPLPRKDREDVRIIPSPDIVAVTL